MTDIHKERTSGYNFQEIPSAIAVAGLNLDTFASQFELYLTQMENKYLNSNDSNLGETVNSMFQGGVGDILGQQINMQPDSSVNIDDNFLH